MMITSINCDDPTHDRMAVQGRRTICLSESSRAGGEPLYQVILITLSIMIVMIIMIRHWHWHFTTYQVISDTDFVKKHSSKNLLIETNIEFLNHLDVNLATFISYKFD